MTIVGGDEAGRLVVEEELETTDEILARSIDPLIEMGLSNFHWYSATALRIFNGQISVTELCTV